MIGIYSNIISFQFTLWSRAEYIDSVDFALNISGAIMETFEQYTNIPFVLPKTGNLIQKMRMLTWTVHCELYM